MKLPILSISDVAEAQLCTGCGACAYAEPDRFRMGDAIELGRRPFVLDNASPETGDAMRVCPGVHLEHTYDRNDDALQAELAKGWGPVYEVWEGYAADEAIRRGGSSGGAATALALYGVERGGMAGVVHTGARGGAPHLNETVYSTDRDGLLARTGSRYAPASPCDGLATIEAQDRPSVFIGKPCDAAAAQRAAEWRPELREKLGVTIAFFCAGTPSTRGTLELLKKIGVDDPASLRSLRYRGNGWPGMWRAVWTDAAGQEHCAEMTYAESWGFLQKYRQWRCYICPDHTGEFADIAVGDPWYRPIEEGEPGKSLIIARTRRGLDYLRAAADAGYLVLETKDANLLPRSQPNLMRTRGRLFGQLAALRLAGVPTPRFIGLPTFHAWASLPLKEKIQSFAATLKRVRSKGLRRRVHVKEGGA